MTKLHTSGSTAHKENLEGPISSQSLGCSRSDLELFRAALPRASLLRDFAVASVCAYAQSGGLAGLDPSSFSAGHDLGPNLARVLIPSLIADLDERGVLMKGIRPFEAYVGIFPSPLFVRAVLQDRTLLHFLNPGQSNQLDKLSAPLATISQHEVEGRWLTAIGSAFLCVPPSSGLSVSDFSKSLQEFDQKDKRVSAVLTALHEKELVTLSTAGAQSEIFFSESFLERLEDGDLVEKLRNSTRQPITFGFMTRERERLEAPVVPSSLDGHQRPSMRGAPENKVTRVAASLSTDFPRTSCSAEDRRVGNKAGREVRDRILAAFERTRSLKMGDLMATLQDLHLTDANVRYHVNLLCDSGDLERTGKGRGALISRAVSSQGVS